MTCRDPREPVSVQSAKYIRGVRRPTKHCVRAPENACVSATVLTVCESCLWGSRHLLPDDSSIRQIRDSTVLSGTHFLLPIHL
jgi:hypothetical protein